MLFLLLLLLTIGCSGKQKALYPGCGRGWCGYIDRDGNIVLKVDYDTVGRFSEGLAAVSKGGKYGYIDTNGTEVIRCEFDMADAFSEGLAPVMKRTGEGGGVVSWGFVDRTGRVVIPPGFASARGFHEGLAAVGYRVFIDDRRQTPPKFDMRLEYRFIDRTGKEAFEGRFDEAGDFSEGLAPVATFASAGQQSNETPQGAGQPSGAVKQYGFIDRRGKDVIARKYAFADEFGEGLAPVRLKEGYFAFIDKSDNVVRRLPTYVTTSCGMVAITRAGPFSEGLAAFCSACECGVIRRSGGLAFRLDATDVSGFKNGLAQVRRGDGTVCYIDTLGRCVWNCE